MIDEVRCSSCGDAARWLITLPYGDDSLAGRILAYCTRCRVRQSGVVVSIPLELVSDDVFLKLYELGYTESAPDTATEITFGEERAEIAESAEALMQTRLPEGLTAQLLHSKGELPAVLHVTGHGVYALWLDEEAYRLLELEPGLGGIAYVGVGAGEGRIARRFEEEWRPENSGRSTPRRKLEHAVIQHVRPPLNINGWQNPARPRLKALRKAVARMAELREQTEHGQ